MKSYVSFFRIQLTAGLQYRAAALAGISTQFAWGFMEILLFSAFYRADPNAFPMNFSDLSSYIWLQQGLLALTASWFIDTNILNTITSGNLAYELCRPINLYHMWIIKNMASRISKAVLRCFPIFIIAAMLPAPYRISFSPNLFTFFIFLFSLLLGFLLINAYSMLVYILTFYTLSPVGVRIIWLAASEFLTGALIPIPFFPESMQTVLKFLPFAAMQNLPFRIYSGDIAGTEMINSLILQIVWTIVLLLCGYVWTNRMLKKAVIQGG